MPRYPVASVPAEPLLGGYLGALMGIIPTFIPYGLGFPSRHVTGVTVPMFGAVVRRAEAYRRLDARSRPSETQSL